MSTVRVIATAIKDDRHGAAFVGILLADNDA